MNRTFLLKYLTIFFVMLASVSAVQAQCPAIVKGTTLFTPEGCARDMVVEFELTYGNLDAGAVVFLDWGDGTVEQFSYASTPTHFSSPTFFKDVFTHQYPPGTGICEYTIRGWVQSGCHDINTSLQEQRVTVWDTDFLFEINPQVFEVCRGTSANLTFYDGGEWNCFNTPVTELENLEDRTLRWTYGLPGSNLEGVKIDPSGLNRDGDMGPYQDTHFVTSAPGNPSRELFVPATRPDGSLHDVGDEFIVQLENWNQCNPFPADAPEMTIARIVIVDPPDPTISVPAGPFCIGEDIPFSVEGGGGYSFAWDFGDGTTSTERTPTHAYMKDSTYEVTVTVSNSGVIGSDCSVSESITVQVLKSPVAAFTISDIATDCGSRTIALTNDSENSDSYEWTITPPAGGSASYTSVTTDNSSPDPSDLSLTGAGAYTIRLLASSTSVPGCPYEIEHTVYVYDRPQAAFTANDICYDDVTNEAIVSFTDNSSLPTIVNNDSINRWEFDYDYDGSVFNADEVINGTFPAGFIHDFGGVGAYRVAMRVATFQGGCYSPVVEDSIFVNPVPEADLQAISPISGCAPLEVRFENLKPDAAQPVDIQEFELKVEDAAGNIYPSLLLTKDQTEFTYTFDNADNTAKKYYVSLVAKSLDACENASVPAVEITVNPAVQSTFSTSGYSPYAANCAPLSVDFQVDGDFATDFPGATYTWTVIDTDGAYDTLMSVPTTSLDTTISFRNHFEDSIADAGIAFKEYEVILSADSGNVCIRPYSELIRVNPRPSSAFTATVLDDNCGDMRIKLEAFQEGLAEYNWKMYENGLLSSTTLADDLSEVIVTVPRPANGMADLTLDFELESRNGFGCYSDVTRKNAEVIIEATETVDVQLNLLGEVDNNTNACDPLTVELENASLTSATGVTYELMVSPSSTFQPESITSGNIEGVFTYQFPAAGYYEFKLRATTAQGCFYESPVQGVTVNPSVVAAFNTDKQQGCGPLDVTFTPSNTANIDRYIWSVYRADDSTQVFYQNNNTQASETAALENTTNSPINYVARLVVESSAGCRDTSETTITVFPQPQTTFEVVGDPACPPYEYRFVNTSDNPVGTVYTWSWGDGSQTTQNGTTVDLSGDTLTYEFFNRNLYSGPDSYNVRLTAQLPDGSCNEAVVNTITLRQDLLADMEILYDSRGCSPLNVEVFNFSLGAASVEWSYREAGTTAWDVFSSDPSSATLEFDNVSDTVKTYEVRLLAIGPDDGTGYCSDEIIEKVNVQPAMPLDFALSATQVCSGGELRVTNLMPQDGVRYTWNWGDGSEQEQAWNTSDSLPHTYYNNSPYGNRSFTITLTAEDTASGCTEALSKEVVVYQDIRLDIEPSETAGCAPMNVVFSNLSQGTSEQTWYVKPQAGFPISESYSSEYTYDFTFENSTNDTLFYEVFYSGMNLAGCKEDTVIEIAVYPEVLADFNVTQLNSDECSPSSYRFEVNNPKAGVEYRWDFGGLSSSTKLDTVYTFENPYVNSPLPYNVTLFARDKQTGCESQQTVELLIQPEMTAIIEANQTSGCAPLEVSIRNKSVLPSVHSWLYRIKGTTDTLDYSTAPEPDNFVFGNTTEDTLIYEVIYTGTNDAGCTDSDTVEISVQPQISAAFEMIITDSCSPVSVEFVNLSAGNRGSVKYFWDFDDNLPEYETASADTVAYTFTNSSFYYDRRHQVTLRAVDTVSGCEVQSTPQIVHVPRQVLAQIAAPSLQLCGEGTLEFENASQDMSYIESYEWELTHEGNTLLQDNSSQILAYDFPENTGLEPEKYVLSLKVLSEAGCESVDQDTIYVYANPKVDFEVVGDSASCEPHVFTFQNNSVVPEGTVFTWDWGNGDISQDSAQQITYDYFYAATNSRTISVRLTATTPQGCETQQMRSIVLGGQVYAGFRLDKTEGCAPLNVQIENNATGQTDSLSYWQIRDNTSQNWRELFASASERPLSLDNPTDSVMYYDVRYVAVNSGGCSDTLTQTVTVYPPAQAAFSVVDPQESYCPPSEVRFVNRFRRPGVSYYWEWQDGSPVTQTDYTQDTVVHTFVNYSNSTIKSYNVRLRAVNENTGCEDEYVQTLTVNPTMRLALEPSAQEGCAPLVVSFTNESQGVSGSHEWFYRLKGTQEKNNIQNSRQVSYELSNTSGKPKVYEIFYTATNAEGCQESESWEVIVHPQLNPNFSVTPQEQTLPSSTISIDNMTPHAANWSYTWNFGDGSKEVTSVNPGSHTYESYGIYNVTLTISNGYCERTFEQTIKIHAIDPEVDFTVATSEGCVPLAIQFENTTKYADEGTYIWDFGDGATSNMKNPSHLYTYPGVYTVTLSAMNETGRRIEVVKKDLITVHDLPFVNFDVRPDTAYLPGQPVTTANRSQLAGPGSQYFWDFGDGNYSFDEEPTHLYEEEGTYDITLVVTNEFGCTDSLTLKKAVEVVRGGDQLVPNAFTPSLGGPTGGAVGSKQSNDVFIPKVQGVSRFRMLIYNRWGEMLFESNNQNIGWDGYYNGRLSPQGVYVYQLFLEYSDGRKESRVGDLTLIR